MTRSSSGTRLQPRRKLHRLPSHRSDDLSQRPGLGEANLAEVVPLLQPGSFVRLRDHPDDLPPFQLIQCHGGRCWVRQQAWGGWCNGRWPAAASPASLDRSDGSCEGRQPRRAPES